MQRLRCPGRPQSTRQLSTARTHSAAPSCRRSAALAGPLPPALLLLLLLVQRLPRPAHRSRLRIGTRTANCCFQDGQVCGGALKAKPSLHGRKPSHLNTSRCRSTPVACRPPHRLRPPAAAATAVCRCLLARWAPPLDCCTRCWLFLYSGSCKAHRRHHLHDRKRCTRATVQSSALGKKSGRHSSPRSREADNYTQEVTERITVGCAPCLQPCRAAHLLVAADALEPLELKGCEAACPAVLHATWPDTLLHR